MFSDADRMIFRFNDGSKERAVDPLAVFIALGNDGVDLEAEASVASTGEAKALGIVVETIRKVFGIEPYSEDNGVKRGLTVGETLLVFQEFADFLTQKKTPPDPLPTSTNFTDSSLSAEQPTESTTPSFSGFGSVATER